MAINFNAMAQDAMETQEEGLKQLLTQQQQSVMGRQLTRSELVQSRAILAAARMSQRNPYDNLTPEQPAPQAVYSQGDATEMSQWKGVK